MKSIIELRHCPERASENSRWWSEAEPPDSRIKNDCALEGRRMTVIGGPAPLPGRENILQRPGGSASVNHRLFSHALSALKKSREFSSHWSFHLLALLCAFTCCSIAAAAQSSFVEAEARTVRGEVLRGSPAQPAPAQLKRGDRLSPGDTIETRRNGYLVIGLSDGSQVTVLAGTRLRLLDFRQARSMRELLDLSVGRVKVKIQHLFNTPNPYRVTSPAASIAVRGTEFLVDVQTSGETTVSVIEGRVDVSSFAQPNEIRSLTAGQQVIVRVDGRIGLAVPGPGLNDRSLIGANIGNPVTQLGAAYQRSVDAVAQNSLEIRPTVFAAFADAHLDSLDNPAYASEFKQAQGRVLFLPSIGKSDRLTINQGTGISQFPYDGEPHRYDSTLPLQASFFSPLPRSRFNIGGSVSSVRTNLQSATLYQSPEQALAAALNVADAGAASLTALNSALVLSRSFGARERTSLGLQVEHLSGDGAFINVQRAPEARLFGGTAIESDTALARTRFTAGLAHEFGADRKLGFFYRYGIASVDQQSRLRTASNDQKPFDQVDVDTRSHEIGARWRSPITKALFYGLEASYLRETSESRRKTLSQAVGIEQDDAWRAAFGGGLGWEVRRNTFLSLDLSGAKFAVSKPVASGPVPIFRFRNEAGYSLSAHAAMQSDLWRKSFVSASWLVIARRSQFAIDSGGFTSIPSILGPLQSTYREQFTRSFSTGGIGWKFKPNLITQYLFSMDHRRDAPSHSILVRFVFDVKE